MVKINDSLSRITKIQIYFISMNKILRGLGVKLFLKKSRGLLFVGKRTHITHKQYIEVGKNVKFEDLSEIQGLSINNLQFGNNVTIGRNTQIRPSSYYGVGEIGYGLKISDNSSIGPNSYVGCAGPINIGKNVMIGPNATLIAENHNFKEKSKSIKSQGVIHKGIHINDNVWIGSNVTILDGVTIGSGTVIAATSLVNKDIPQNTLYINKKNVYSKNI